jgi:cephalosporin-C deacetylase-like acetyl esterase
VYAVSIDCAGPRPATGFLTVPAKPGKYPARITLHGYGKGPAYSKGPRISGHANCIGFDLNAHGYEIGREKEYYDRFFESIRSNGMSYGFDPVQNRDPEQCYFSGMTYRLMRALEYIKSLPEWDGKNLTSHGGSQGGLQSVWAAALDPDVSVASVGFPWLCDMSGKDLGGRIADSWRIHWSPGLGYYDPVNLARRIGKNCRVNIFRAGLGDYCCPPSGVAALYNAMTCPKRITWIQGSTHNYVPPPPHQKFVLSEGDWEDK